MDEDINQMSKDQLMEEVRKLRAAIREHRDSTGQNLCWHHPRLWSLLPEQIEPKISVPEWPEFMKGCVKYRQSLDMEYQKKRDSVGLSYPIVILLALYVLSFLIK
jgi:hypothetical protein